MMTRQRRRTTYEISEERRVNHSLVRTVKRSERGRDFDTAQDWVEHIRLYGTKHFGRVPVKLRSEVRSLLLG